MKNVTLSQETIQKLIKFFLENGYDFSREQGGVVFGRMDGETIHVEHLIVLKNRHRKYHKYAAGLMLVWVLLRLYLKAGNKLVYLGNWHFHVSDDALPSNQDIETMKLQTRIFRRNMVMLIIARSFNATLTQFDYVKSWRGYKRFVDYRTLEVREVL